MDLNLDNTRLRTLIPNIIHEVEGETPLYEKMLPWLTSARLWLEQNVLADFQPEGELRTLAEKIIVYKAFSEAVPSLDVTLSPAGFAVINTDGRAPASKERVERLVASLDSFVDANLAALVLELHKFSAWTSSYGGQWFRATFIPHLGYVPQFRRDKDILTTYRAMRDLALRFEQELSESYLGESFLSDLRSVFPAFEGDGGKDIYEMIVNAELRYISFHLCDQKAKCPDGHEVWHLARPIIAQLNYWPELKAKWEQEMGEKIKVTPFKNTVRGGFFF
jgi:hypothetical protein